MEAFTCHSLCCRKAFGRARRALRRGLFHRKDSAPGFGCGAYCGTFYYYEPESTTFLAYNTSYRSFNKATAFKELMNMLEESDSDYWNKVVDLDGNNCSNEIIEYQCLLSNETDSNSSKLELEHSKLNLFMSGKLPADLMISPNELVSIMEVKDESLLGKSLTNVTSKDYKASRLASKIPQRKYYAGAYLGLYALEDDYDQAICLLCKRLGIDILILQNMVGSFQVVTEVLDSRSRTDSLRSLVYLK